MNRICRLHGKLRSSLTFWRLILRFVAEGLLHTSSLAIKFSIFGQVLRNQPYGRNAGKLSNNHKNKTRVFGDADSQARKSRGKMVQTVNILGGLKGT